MAKRPLTLLLLLAWIILAASRIAGPSDLYDKEQPRTVAYTADMLQHHHYILPYDTFGIPATKPPLYNWITLPFVALVGFQEWALKTPSLIASLIILLTLCLAARHFDAGLDPPLPSAPRPQPTSAPNHTTKSFALLGLLAALLYLATPMTAKLLYLARPDMLLTATLTIAWLAATIIVQSPVSRPKAQLVFWLATAAAALAKGPSALLALAYLLLAAKIIGGKFSALKRSGYLWGLPLLLAIVTTYFVLAYRQEPEFFRQVLLGREVSGRIASSPKQLFATLLNGPFYAFTRFLPWSFLPLLLLLVPAKKWRSHPLAPAFLWLALILVVFSFMTTKRPDRYAPIFPQLALLAAYPVIRLPELFRQKAPLKHQQLFLQYVVAAAFITILVLVGYNQFFTDAAETHYGDHAIAFATSVKKITHDAPILFTDGELTPVETLRGQNQPPNLTPATLDRFHWSIRFYDPSASTPAPTLISDTLDQIDGPYPGRLALFSITPAQAQILYHQSQVGLKFYANNNTSNSPKNPDNQWTQFTRPHTAEPPSPR